MNLEFAWFRENSIADFTNTFTDALHLRDINSIRVFQNKMLVERHFSFVTFFTKLTRKGALIAEKIVE